MGNKNQTVLITGGARRVGAALTRSFAAQGYQVALHYNRSKTEAEALANEVGASLYQADLTAQNAPAELMEEVSQKHPNLSVLINNASTFRRMHLTESSEQTMAEDIAINLTVPMNLMREFGLRVKKGSIINLLDTSIYGTHPAHFAYLVAKKGLAEATKMAAREYMGMICVNGICPGHLLPTEGDAEHEPKFRPVKPTVDQVVEAALMLAESDTYTGQLLNIDGGESVL